MSGRLLSVPAHRYVAHLCEEMAQAVYEELAKSNLFYAANPDRAAFVRWCAPTLRDEARTVMGELLGRHEISEEKKAYIYEALLKDRSIPGQPRGWKQPTRH